MIKMIREEDKKRLEKAGYRFCGKNGAVEICTWTKKAILDEDFCYKQKFYGIRTHRCLQMTPALPFCTHNCVFCWRDTSINKVKYDDEPDDPEELLDCLIKKQRELLSGFPGNKKANQKKVKEAFEPKHIAISLAGEPTLYPKLDEFIEVAEKRGMTTFLVSNGTQPDVIKNLKHLPTQLYITLPAPDEETYLITSRPLIPDGWQRILKTLEVVKELKGKTRRVIRLTLVKGFNLKNADGYAKLIKIANPDFVELKGYVWVGFSRERLHQYNMPTHKEIKSFAEELAKELNWKIVDEKENSRVVLLMKEDKPWRIMKFND